MKYTIRFDITRDDAKVKQFFNNELSRGNLTDFIVAFEIASKTKKEHYQGMITIPSEKHLQLIRTNLKYNFKVDKTMYSIAKVTSEAYKYYIVKGKDIVHSFGYNIETIMKEYDEFTNVKKMTSAKGVRDEFVRYIEIHSSGPLKRELLVNLTLDYFKAKKMLFSMELVHKYVLYWYNHSRDDDGKEMNSFVKSYLDVYWGVHECYAPQVNRSESDDML